MIELFLPSLILQISAKLLYVSEIFRNGASEPLSPFLYFKDSPFEGKENPRSFGNLTQFGEEQQFLLGVALQKKYYHNYNFLPSEFEEEIIEIYSDSNERAVRSACSHVLGLFSEKKFTYLPNSTLPHLSLPPFSPYYDDFLRSDPTGVFIKRVREYGNYHRILNHVNIVFDCWIDIFFKMITLYSFKLNTEFFLFFTITVSFFRYTKLHLLQIFAILLKL